MLTHGPGGEVRTQEKEGRRSRGAEGDGVEMETDKLASRES